MYREVLEFHRMFGHPVGYAPKFLVPERLAHRRQWQESEREEFAQSVIAKDIAGAADAIADEIYFLIGTAVEMGIPLGKVFKAVHAANMRKVWREGPHLSQCEISTAGNARCTCGKLRYTAVGRVLKPDGWVGPEEEIKRILGVK